MEDQNKEQFPQEDIKLTLKDKVNSYLRNYPLFIIAFAICVAAAILYLRYTKPKYKVHTQMLVKSESSRSQGSDSKDLIETALSGGNINLDNELRLLQSADLMNRVVLKNGYNVTYYKKGNVLDREVYLNVPFRLVPQAILDSSKCYNILVEALTGEGGYIELPDSGQKSKLKFRWYQPFTVSNQKFVLVPNGARPPGYVSYQVTWTPVEQSSAALLSAFYAAMLDNKTSIIDMSLLVENPDKGKDVLNAICSEYILANIEEKKQLAQNTIHFIDDRLNVVAADLGGVEENLEDYQSSNRITSVEQQSSSTYANSNTVDKDLVDISNQQAVVDMISKYVSNPDYRNKLVPSTLGLSDATLSSMINHYNELQLRKEKEALYVQGENEVMKDIVNQINGVRGSIVESLQNIARNLRLKENSLREQGSRYQQILSSLPHKERVMQDIKRKQTVTEDLYLYLLKRREEVAISSATSNKADYKQIDNATGYGPVEPDTRKIWIMTVLTGLLLPAAIINIRNLLNDKIAGRSDIVNRSAIPILGEVNHVARKNLEGTRILSSDAAGEQFRIIRTRLSFLQRQADKKVILVSSFGINEGKSFISAHLAAVLAVPGKMVALVNLDLRKQTNVDYASNDLADFLSGKSSEIYPAYQVSEDTPSLHSFTVGLALTNPSDFLLNERTGQLFTQLRKRYDHIIVDSPPAGLVSDAHILSKYADTIIFVVRQNHTPKKKLALLNEFAKATGVASVFFILNDIKPESKRAYDKYFVNSNQELNGNKVFVSKNSTA